MRRAIQPVSLLPTAEPTRDDILFFAGFYDGEGCAQGKGASGIVVHVTQKDQELLHRGRSLWGGSIHLNNRGVSAWVLSGDRARLFLMAIYPYVSSRRQKQIEEAKGLKLSGRKMHEESGMTQERALARAALGGVQRHSETCVRWAKNNPEKQKEITDRYRANNREKINARQREWRASAKLKSYTSQEQISERSAPIN